MVPVEPENWAARASEPIYKRSYADDKCRYPGNLTVGSPHRRFAFKPPVAVSPVAISRAAPYPRCMESLRPTTRLIAACCRRSDDAGRADAIATHLRAISDWEGFGDAVKRHRVYTQTYEALKNNPAVPAGVIEALRQRVHRLRLRRLRQMSELLRITSALRNAGIRVAEIKGMTLGVLAYGTADLKESIDLDLLVAPDAAVDAVQLLLAEGYAHQQVGTRLRADQIRALVRNRKDLPLIGPHKTKLELHWRLSQGASLLKGAGELAWQEVEVASGHMASTLAMPDLVAYLAVHGSLHDWARIKWLADFDALFRRASASQRSEWIEHAQMLGAGRCLQLAIAVGEHVIGPYVDHASGTGASVFASDPATLRGLAHNLRCIEAPYPPPRETLQQKLSLARDDFSTKVALFQRLIDSRSLIRQYFFVEKDILRFPLPDRLRYLYPALRGAVWIGDRLPRAGRKLQAAPLK